MTCDTTCTAFVAIPLGQGQVFNSPTTSSRGQCSSQSLWVRDRFLMTETILNPLGWDVAIPLGQGQVFNLISIS